ncbi:MAG TPA: hypothetical protein VF904_02820 [Anaeromyxobacteraceae bacterium]
MTMTRGNAVAVLVAIAVCGGCDSVPPGAITKCQATSVIAAPVKTDILFVVDDSGSMANEQQGLADNFKAFIDRLAASPVKNEFRIGITTTSVVGFPSDSWGSTVYSPITVNAGEPYPRGALVAIDPATGKIRYDATAKAYTGTRILEADSPTLADDFKANVKVGTGGSGKEMGLEAARLALTERIADGTNAGFLRPGARLAVIIVSDEDDCTDGAQSATTNDQCHDPTFKQNGLQPVQTFIDLLHGTLAGERRDVVVATIIGTDVITHERGSSCSTAFDAGLRYWDFANAFGDHGLIDSICNVSFGGTLDAIAGLIDPGQEIDLTEDPGDWRLLAVSVSHPTGTPTNCEVAPVGAVTATAGAIFTSSQSGQPAKLRFQNGCTLQQGDQVSVQLLCAG